MLSYCEKDVNSVFISFVSVTAKNQYYIRFIPCYLEHPSDYGPSVEMVFTRGSNNT